MLECWKTLHNLNMPSAYYTEIDELLDHVTRVFTSETFSIALAGTTTRQLFHTITVNDPLLVNNTELKTMYTTEEWEIVDQQHTITALPFAFESMMKSILSELEGLLQQDDVQCSSTELSCTLPYNIYPYSFL